MTHSLMVSCPRVVEQILLASVKGPRRRREERKTGQPPQMVEGGRQESKDIEKDSDRGQEGADWEDGKHIKE